MLDTFYATASQICFALLGLWWLVVQFKYQEWMAEPARRRAAYNISLYFMLPGIMSLVSLLAGQSRTFWQVAFILASALGAFETARLLASLRRDRGGGLGAAAGRWLALALYALVLVFAVYPPLAQVIAPGLTALQLEGTLLALLIFLGVQFAWEALAEKRGG